MSKSKVSGGAAIVLLLLTPILVVLGTLIGGFVIQTLWGWFAVPFGVPALTVLHAAGISLLVSYLCPVLDTSDLAKKETDSPIVQLIGKLFGHLVFRPAIFLGLGWAIHQFM